MPEIDHGWICEELPVPKGLKVSGSEQAPEEVTKLALKCSTFRSSSNKGLLWKDQMLLSPKLLNFVRFCNNTFYKIGKEQQICDYVIGISTDFVHVK